MDKCLGKFADDLNEWMKDGVPAKQASQQSSRAKARATAQRPSVDLQSERVTTSESGRQYSDAVKPSDGAAIRSPVLPKVTRDLCSATQREWLHKIYESGFETIFGSWMGKYSNPFM
jgi:hypothetical protein